VSEGLNCVHLLGNLGADPEFKMTQGGTGILKLRMAVNERYRDRDGAWKDKVEWVSVVLFGKRAESLQNYLSKGSSLFVEGRLSTTSYEKNGEKRYSTQVVADKIILTGWEVQRVERYDSPRGRTAPKQAPDDGPADDMPADDEDLPF
jgi:single-strand DNA-binding protein